MKEVGVVGWVAILLVVIGGLNYGLVGFFNYNLLDAIFGTGAVMRIIYAFIGISAVYTIFYAGKCCKGSSGSSRK